MAEPERYTRSPLPRRGPGLAWVFTCVAALACSPFAGFALRGRVDGLGLTMGLGMALVPLAVLVVLVAWRWWAWRALPAPLRLEHQQGRIVPAEGAPPIAAPVIAASRRHRLELRSDGVIVAAASVLSMPGIRHPMATAWVMQQLGHLFVAWPDVQTWTIETDPDGPDVHSLDLRGGGQVRARRFAPDGMSEAALLDAVRSIGRVPIRLRADVERPGADAGPGGGQGR